MWYFEEECVVFLKRVCGNFILHSGLMLLLVQKQLLGDMKQLFVVWKLARFLFLLLAWVCAFFTGSWNKAVGFDRRCSGQQIQ